MTQENASQLDCVVRVITPENVEFDYMVAGPFQRLPAYLVDWFLRVFVFVILLVIGGIIGGFTGTGYLVIAGLIVLYFVMSWFYGVLMETYVNGRTLGKMLFRLRVLSTDGRPISGTQAALRNLVKVADLFPPLTIHIFSGEIDDIPIFPTFLFGLLAMTLSGRMQRLGDLVSGTMVVSDRVRGVAMNLQPEDPRAFALAEHIPPTFMISRTLARVVGLYMERRSLLHPLRRAELAAHVAEPLIREFGLMKDTSTDLLMCALYVRIYHSRSQREQLLEKSKQYMRPQVQAAPKPITYAAVQMPSPSYDVQVVAGASSLAPGTISDPVVAARAVPVETSAASSDAIRRELP
ncbi:MAG: RDD family protein [Pirellulales bacterium]